MSDLVMPTSTKPAPRTMVTFPQPFIDLVEENYRAYRDHGRNDVDSTFDTPEHAESFGKALKSYSDNRVSGGVPAPITIRFKVTDNVVRWYAKDREVRKPGTKTDSKPANKPATGARKATK